MNKKYLKVLLNAVFLIFFSSVTPSATGGQPMQLFYMKKDYKKEAKDITESALLEAVKETTGIEYESVDKYEECTIADYMNSIIKKL